MEREGMSAKTDSNPPPSPDSPPDSPSVPAAARAVVIGGGVAGCSVAYHLAKLGWETVLLERKRLTCGTTWHAAGLVGQLRPSRNLTRLARYSARLYAGLESETGFATGLRLNGSVSVALTDERAEELRRLAGLARAFEVDARELSPAELRDLCPHLKTDDATAAVHLPGDGQCDPANVALALAKGARQSGAKIFENIRVTELLRENGARCRSPMVARRGRGWRRRRRRRNKMRSRRQLRRNVGAANRRDGGNGRPPASLRAFLHRHRAD